MRDLDESERLLRRIKNLASAQLEVLVEIRDLLVAQNPSVLDITAAGDVITSQSAPTTPGPDSSGDALVENSMAQTLTLSIKSTEVHTIPLTLTSEADGSTQPIPTGDTFSATSPSPAIGVAIDNTAFTMAINALTLPSANTMGMTFDVTDSDGDVALHIVVNYPVPVVNDVSAGVDVVTSQPAPTASGP